MLRTEFRFSLNRVPQRILAVLLGEAFLGFLAIIAVALTLFPMLFPVKPGLATAIDNTQWVIIGWFGIEYLIALASAEDRIAFVINP